MKLFLIFLLPTAQQKSLAPSAETGGRKQENSPLLISKVPFLPPSWAATTQSMIVSYENQMENYERCMPHSSRKIWMKTGYPKCLRMNNFISISQKYLQENFTAGDEANFLLKRKTRNLFKAENSACDELQQQYDEETDHGTKEDIQEKWKKGF